MHAPQILVICLLAFWLTSAPIVHGKQSTRNGVVMVIDAMVWVLVLWWGGFWSQP